MSIHDWDQWKIDNPDWERYFNAENSPGLGVEVSDWQSRLIKQKPEWNEVLDKASKAPGSTVKKTLIMFILGINISHHASIASDA